MTQYVYGDVLFVINFSMDFLSLYIAGRILHLDMKLVRLLCGATAGGLYGVLALTYSVPDAAELLITASSGIFICFIAHYHGHTARFFCTFLLFFAVSLFMGGTMTFLYARLGKYKNYIRLGGNMQMILDDIPILLFVGVALVSVLISMAVGRLFQKKKCEWHGDIVFTVAGKEIEASCLADSGNLLTEPISGIPVVFLSNEIGEKLPLSVREALSGRTENAEPDLLCKLRFIPTQTVAGRKITVAVVPERFYVKSAQKEYEPKRVCIALDTEHPDFEGFEGLIPVSVMS